MDRISEIIELESQANKHDGSASERNWKASRLIWEELETGKSKTQLAEEISKHRTHVLFMSRCWELVGRYYSNGTLPNFYQTYNSDLVRNRNQDGDEPGSGPSSADSGKASSGKAKSRKDEPEDDPRENGSNWIKAADQYLSLLAEHQVAWQFLTPEDIDRLRSLSDLSIRILRRLGHSGSS